MRSSFVRRQLMLVIATIILASILISVAFTFYAQRVIIGQKVNEFERNAQRVWALYYNYSNHLISEGYYLSQIDTSLSIWDAKVAIFNGEGMLQAASSKDMEITLAPVLDQILSGEATVYMGNEMFLDGELIVGKPFFDEENKVIGAVIMTRDLSDLTQTLSSFNAALRVSMLAVLLLMLLPTYIAAKFLSRPIYQMRDIALRMADGDFSARANERVRGEIGVLGATLNHLSLQLSYTIQALEVEKSRLASIVDGLGEGIVAIDAQGEITHINPAMLQIFHVDEQYQDLDRLQLIPDATIWQDFDATVENRQITRRSFSWGERVLRITLTPLEGEDGSLQGAVGLFRDVTEQERLEQTRRDYVANVSHELRTPVSSVRGLTEALKDGLIKEEGDRQRYYGFILRETMRLTRLIEDLLELSRLQSGTIAFTKAKIDVSELLLEFAERYQQIVSDVGIDFELSLPENCPMALTNADRIDQVLVILLDNAIKFTPADGLVRLCATWDDQNITIMVCDTGTGIEASDLAHIFERFYKVDKAHTGQGTGLGLSIAQEIIQQLGSSISVKSVVDQGTTFRFTIPIAQ